MYHIIFPGAASPRRYFAHAHGGLNDYLTNDCLTDSTSRKHAREPGISCIYLYYYLCSVYATSEFEVFIVRAYVPLLGSQSLKFSLEPL